MSSSAAPYNITIDRGSDWSKVLTLSDNNGDPVAVTNIFTVSVSITGTTSPSVVAASLTYVSTDLWSSNGNATAPGSGTWIRVRRSGGAWEITHWVAGVQSTGYWTSSSNPNHPAWVETWTAAAGATGSPVVDSAGMFFEGSVSLQERGPDVIPFSFDTVGDGSAGQVEISLSRSYTRALANSGAYRFDWFVYHGRERIRLVAGRISAQGSSTGTSTGIPVPAFGSSPSVAWGNITGTLSNQTDLQAAFDAKQSTLVSGTSIKTINGTSLLGSGDVVVSGAVSDGDKGSITVSSSGTVWTIDAGAVTNTMLAGSIALSKLATSSTSASTADTLVLRDGTGGTSFAGTVVMNVADIADLQFQDYQAAVGATFTYGAGAAAAHRTALEATATGVALFTAASASAARTTLGSRTFTKPSDESRSSNSTYTVDTHLKDIPLETGKSYKIEFYIPAYVPTTEGGKVRLLLPLSSRATVPNMNGGVSVTTWGNGAGGSVGTSTSGAPAGMRYFTLQAAAGHNQNRAISGVAFTDVIASSANLSVEWAQNTSGINATILLAGSTIVVTEL